MSIENEMLIQKLFPENPMSEHIRPVKKKCLDRTSSGEYLLLKNTVGNEQFNALNLYGRSKQGSTSGKQLYDVDEVKKDARVSTDDDGWITVKYDNSSGSSDTYTGVNNEKSALIQPSKTYALICEIKTLTGGILSAVTGYKDACKGQFATSANYTTTGTFVKHIVTEDDFEDCTTMLRTIFTSDPGENSECTFRLSVVDDLTVTDNNFVYEPFTGGVPSPNPDYPQEIASIGDDGVVDVGVYGANIFDYPSGIRKEFTELSIELTEDGGLHVVGTPAYKYRNIAQQKKVIPKGKYYCYKDGVIGEKSTYCQISYKKNGTTEYKTGSVAIEQTEECTLQFNLREATDYNDTYYPMINVGDTPLNFEPYKGMQTLSIKTKNGLPGIPVSDSKLANYTDSDGQMWCCDEVDFERGVYVQRIEKMNLTSDLNYKIAVVEDYTRFKIFCDSLMFEKRIPVISNRFTYGTAHEVGTAFTYNGEIYIYPPKTVTTVDELRTWLDANPTEVFYILENPIEKQITEEEMEAFENLKTNENTTTVLNSESAYMSVGYKVPLPRRSKNSALKMWFREHPIIQ